MWKQIGTVNVDSGLVMIGDPCYASRDGNFHPIHNWDSFCDLLGEDYPTQVDLGGVGVVVSSGYGDGSYPVFAKVTDEDDGWGPRVRELKVVFS